MKVLDYALSALAASTTGAQHAHAHQHAAISYPTLGFDFPLVPHAPREPIQTPSATTLPSRLPAATHHVIQVIKPRSVVSNDQTPDPSKPMLGLYAEDQVTTETTTFENGIDSTKWIVDTRGYGGSGDNPFLRQMDPNNVDVVDGCLQLKVPGGQKYDPENPVGLSSAQIMSTKKFSVGSLEMKVKMSSEGGTCQCGFLYGSDNNEVDMEYLTRTNVSWAVVQALKKEQPIQQVNLNVTTDQTDGFHTYKLVRTESKAYFLMDGELVNTFDNNIPTEPVQAMVAHWTDANPGWTGGPPAKDTVMTVEKVVVEYVGATETFTTSTGTPSATGSPGSSSSAKGAASRGHLPKAGPLLAIAAFCFYLAL
ncbi:glycoside hydrolase family 16 protein [Karstenula rhodostoma CBS 690.94]|uniref:Glycoside hydrolase family 16 protein n=1 Tax=Karstenula rhodostoma CBS 690.94 TaxID=1392251 RepID=A0A9P4P8X6_9PLEO|nr:glycoside hydrolase family 16 protein [Karstenula rhodostoma CBS 690.94]